MYSLTQIQWESSAQESVVEILMVCYPMFYLYFIPTHIKLFAVASFSIFGSVESVDGNPHIGSSNLCIPTQDQLIQSIMDEVVLGLRVSGINDSILAHSK